MSTTLKHRTLSSAIVDQLPDEARVRREPTDEELARTLPSGYHADPAAEQQRRPGTD